MVQFMFDSAKTDQIYQLSQSLSLRILLTYLLARSPESTTAQPSSSIPSKRTQTKSTIHTYPTPAKPPSLATHDNHMQGQSGDALRVNLAGRRAELTFIDQ